MILKKKILTGYGVIFMLLSLVITWAVVNLVSLGQATDAILSENYRSILASNHMITSLERQDSYLLLKLLHQDDYLVTDIQEQDGEFLQWLARAKDNITITGEQELVNTIEEYYRQYRSAVQTRFLDLTIVEYQDTLYPLFIHLQGACYELKTLNEKTMYSASDAARNAAARAVWSTAILAAVAVVFALSFSMFLAGRIVKPIERFMDASRKISLGDYSIVVPIETTDELGLLAEEFNEMTAKLKNYHELNIEQILSEKRKVEAILSSIEDGLIVFNMDLHVTGINPAARHMFSLEFSEYTALHCRDIIHDQTLLSLVDETLKSGRRPATSDENSTVLELYQHGRKHHYLYSITIIRSRENTMTGIVLLLRDVTHLKDVERMKSEFVMAASHELRTPLTSMGMSIDLIQEHVSDKLESREQELLEVAQEEIRRMKALVNDLLDLSKLEAGSIEMEIESVTVSSLMQHIEGIFKSQADMRQVTLEFSQDKDASYLRADANKITWVLSNLLSNALRYVPNQGKITVSAKRIAGQVHISVSDNGPGIPQEYQTKVFQKFIQINDEHASGTGLGLAICKEIVRAHGGSIWVDSIPGEGCTFTFAIPAV